MAKRPEAQQRPGTPPGVFILDDESDVLGEYAEFMELQGLACRCETDPRRAVDAVVNDPGIDVVVTDMRMPGLDGWAFIELVTSRLSGGRHISFIIVTGDDTACAEARRVGIPIMHKPVDPYSLVEEVRRQCVAS